MKQGWIKFYREWLDNPTITKDGDYMLVWIYLLSKAQFTEEEAYFRSEKIKLNAGQLLTNHKDIYERFKIEPCKLRRILNLLKNDYLIDYQTDKHKTLITLRDWDIYQSINDYQNDYPMTNQRLSKQETENEKEKRSKREKDKEKEIKKNERMKENIYPSISPQGEMGRDDFSPSSEKTLFSSDNRIVRIPQTEEELGKWLEEDDGIDEWDKMTIFYKNLNSGQQDSYTEYEKTNGFDNTNPISEKNKVYNELHPHTPSSCEAKHTEGVHEITQEACMESTHRVVWNQPQGCMDFNPVSKANPYPLSPDPCTMFDEFWQAYPKKVGKGYAFECFKKIKPSRKLVDTMLEAIAKQKKSDMWKRDKGQYIPNPSTWLNQKRWEDDLGGDDDDTSTWNIKFNGLNGIEF